MSLHLIKICVKHNKIKAHNIRPGKRYKNEIRHEFLCRTCHYEANKTLRINNKERINAYHREYYKKNPERSLNHSLLTKHKITLESYEDMYRSQNGVCAICQKINILGRRLEVDHCHATGRIRGLLCHPCNNALGKVYDNVNVLQSAIKYLQKHEVINASF